ncbi:MAG: hypothetical protein M1825_002063 [Sarcosagium campestre]|nr:MAG: hypothetical protein M1825_002063 [Sarcosagium campestre]
MIEVRCADGVVELADEVCSARGDEEERMREEEEKGRGGVHGQLMDDDEKKEVDVDIGGDDQDGGDEKIHG